MYFIKLIISVFLKISINVDDLNIMSKYLSPANSHGPLAL